MCKRNSFLVILIIVIFSSSALLAQDFCDGNFDYDQDVNGSDAVLFKEDFGRSKFLNPCPNCVVGNWCIYP